MNEKTLRFDTRGAKLVKKQETGALHKKNELRTNYLFGAIVPFGPPPAEGGKQTSSSDLTFNPSFKKLIYYRQRLRARACANGFSEDVFMAAMKHRPNLSACLG